MEKSQLKGRWKETLTCLPATTTLSRLPFVLSLSGSRALERIRRITIVIVYVFQELDEMKKRLKEMEEEAAALREMQAKVEKEMGAVQGCFLMITHYCFRLETSSHGIS